MQHAGPRRGDEMTQYSPRVAPNEHVDSMLRGATSVFTCNINMSQPDKSRCMLVCQTRYNASKGWLTDDARLLIFSHLERQDLCKLARTSQCFFHLTVDELWRNIDDIGASVCSPPPPPSPDFDHRPLNAEDIQRRGLYTSKVQHAAGSACNNSPSSSLKKADLLSRNSGSSQFSGYKNTLRLASQTR